MAVEGYVSSVSKRHFLDQAVANGRVTSWLYISLSLSSVWLEDSLQSRDTNLMSLPHASFWELFLTNGVPQTLLKHVLGTLNQHGP